jgi:hypothetical protein
MRRESLVPPGGHNSNPDRIDQLVQLLKVVRLLKASDRQLGDAGLS